MDTASHPVLQPVSAQVDAGKRAQGDPITGRIGFRAGPVGATTLFPLGHVLFLKMAEPPEQTFPAT